ncbi:DNA helicase UvrD [Candidatus Gottesmanbacteria bacterium]|nr:DNA helicase UvrD [Candidatus Gottesmanbacteria bacterium]
MRVIADLQLHSKFSRAVSPAMTIPNIAAWAQRKGIGLVATGDWTHPMWMAEIERDLEEVGNGLLRLKNIAQGDPVGAEVARPNSRVLRSLAAARAPSAENSNLSGLPAPHQPLFLLATEVSSIFSQGGKVRRVHTLIWVPTLESARKISREMTKRGCNLMSDGRPIVGLSCIHIAELVLSIEPKALIIPAHAWTPWFSVFGEKGGFESLDEAFGEYAKHIYAVETGLSSNPAMNWRIKELDHRAILSFSDAHSGPKLGREATVFEIADGKLSYASIYQAICGDQMNYESRIMNAEKINTHDSVFGLQYSNIAYTIEFYPEEGKYHWSGHRACGIRWGPEETRAKGTTCPVCGKPLIQGVVQRVEALASRSEEALKLESRIMNYESGGKTAKIRMTQSRAFPNRPPFVMLVPLQEIISECIGSPVASPKVQGPYTTLTDALGGEFSVLLQASIEEIAVVGGERIAQGVDKVRRGDLVIDPGYDGVFGVVKLWREGEEKPLVDKNKEQLRLI